MKFVVLASVFLLAVVAAARLPEPNNIYYGRLTVLDGAALTGEVDAVLIARVNGIDCAYDEVTGSIAPDVNYVLRVPLDDGWEGLYAPYAARRGDAPVVTLLYEGDEFPVDEELPGVSDAGALHRIDLEATPEPSAAVIAACALAFAARSRKVGG
jgi:hypothetical protein